MCAVFCSLGPSIYYVIKEGGGGVKDLMTSDDEGGGGVHGCDDVINVFLRAYTIHAWLPGACFNLELCRN